MLTASTRVLRLAKVIETGRGRPRRCPGPSVLSARPEAPCRPRHAPPTCPLEWPSLPLVILPPTPPLPLQSGATPLHAAVASFRTPVVALLLTTPGVDPLAKSRVRGAQRHLRACLPAANPSSLLKNRKTPLDVAQSKGKADAAALLRADPRVTAALAAAGEA